MQQQAYLMMVTGNNNNKFYKMSSDGNTLSVEYGRVGASAQQASYPARDWDKKYSEKIRKGYKDVTDLRAEVVSQTSQSSDEKDEPFAPISDKAINEIVSRLISYARQTVRQNYRVSSESVTQAMVDKAQGIIDQLSRLAQRATVRRDEANEVLLELFAVIPRKMQHVSDYLVTDTSKIGQIVGREQSLLDVMQGQIAKPIVMPKTEKTKQTKKQQTILEAMGLKLSPVTDKDVEKIKKLLGPNAYQYKNAWRMTNLKTQEAFDKYLEENGNRMKRKLYWHGSRNENWWSIFNTGLVLRPSNAVITGKMFGFGIYFANKAQKSIGYTSLRGAHWTRGGSRNAFLALFDCAFGKPYEVTRWRSELGRLDEAGLKRLDPKANCLFVKGGYDLHNDEIIFYREDQLTIKYLVEIGE